MAGDSIQKKLERVRPPRVQIKYEVEIGNALELKELPFVVGVMGDYSGKPDQPLPKLKDRKFVEIDRDNFNEVMKSMTPRLAYRVEDKISGKADSKLNVELRFNNLSDFSPENVVQQVEPLRKLLEARQQLEELKTKMDGNDKLTGLLEQVLNNANLQQDMGKSLNVEPTKEG
ncbi:type VI secretion system contractile sheath small subunit [Anatilimnocola floriformis]|uniref:type VI secretion system contractile sheath small subunit n=1 Tax=Anatilimnocola floriformis TaxID=2948575 RepID=UPI0020C35606|nr:type VI secretion system contractile sheath small subunit [Anatilimnocola floriformis]